MARWYMVKASLSLKKLVYRRARVNRARLIWRDRLAIPGLDGLAAAAVLILDEATSSLDTESEQLIQEGLGYLFGGRTSFVIAHRLSTVRRADQIRVLESGRLVERGDHDTLCALGGRYSDMHARQQGARSRADGA